MRLLKNRNVTSVSAAKTVYRALRGSTALAGGVVASLLTFAPIGVQAQVVWNGATNTNALTGTNWVGNTAPGAGDQAQLNTAAGNQPTLGGATTYTGLAISDGTYTVGGAGTLTSPITLSGTGNLSISAGGSVTGLVTAGGATVSNAGTITGNLIVTAGTFTNAAVVTGTTTVSGGILNLNAGTNLADAQLLTISGGTVNVNASDTVGGLAGTGGTLNFATGTALTVNQAGNTSFAGAVTGTSAFNQTYFIKDGAGTLTLSGANTTTGVGAFVINAGTVVLQGGNAIGDNNAVGLNGGTLELQANETIGGLAGSGGTLQLNGNTLTLAGVGAVATGTLGSTISGTGGIILNAPNFQQVLSGANTYTGGTTITAGTLTLGNAAGLGAAAGALTINGGTLNLAGFSPTVASLNGTSGNITNTVVGNAILTVNGGGTQTYAGTFNPGPGLVSLTVAGGTALTLNGAANLQNVLISNAAVVTLNAASTITGSISVISAGTLVLNAANTMAGGINIGGGGGTSTLILGATGAAGGAGNTITTFGSIISYANGVDNATPININSPDTQLRVLGTDVATQSGIISETAGPRPLEKIGTGTLVLTGANTYTGLTTISAGTLSIGAANNLGTDVATNGLRFNGNGARLVTTANVTMGRTVDVAAGGATIDTLANNLTLNGALTSTNGTTLAKDGAGDLVVNAATNQFNGALNITNGRVLVNAASFGGNAAGSQINVNAGTLATGPANTTLTSVVSVNGGTLAIGDAPAIAGGVLTATPRTLSIAPTGGGVALNMTGGSLVVQLGQAGVVGGPNNDLVQLTGSGSFAGGTIAGTAPVTGGRFTIADTTAGVTLAGTTSALGTLYVVGNRLNLRANCFGACRDRQSFDATDVTGNGVLNNGAGVWNNAATNWTGPAGQEGVNDSWQGDIAVFRGPGTSTATIGGGVAARALEFDTTGHIVTGGPITIAGDTGVGTAGRVTVGAGVVGTIRSEIQGNSGLRVDGAGRLILTGNNTFTGNVAIAPGATLQLGDVATGLGQTGSFVAASRIGLEGGATFEVNRNDVSAAPFTLANQIVDLAPPAGIRTVNVTGGGALTLTGVNGGANNFTGVVNVLNGSQVSFNGVTGDTVANAAVVNVLGGSTIGGTGTIAGTVNVGGATAGTLSPGALFPGQATGTLQINGNLNLAANSTTNFQLNTSQQIGGVGPTGNDLVNVGGALAVAAGAVLNVGPAVTGYYRLFNVTGAGAATATNFTVNPPAGSTASVYNIVAAPNQVNLLLANGGQSLQFWDGTDQTGATAGAQGGTSAWNAANTNWTQHPGGVINDRWRSGVGVFLGTAGTVALTGPQGFQGLQFSTTGYVVDGPGTLNATGNPFGNAGASFLNIDGGVTTTINAAISGNLAIGLDKLGTGTLVLTGTNTYFGLTDIQAGVVRISNGAALGAGTGTLADGTRVRAGAALELTGTITVANEALALNGTGIANGGALRNLAGNNTMNGPVTLESVARINSDAGLLTLGGAMGGAGQNLTVGGAGNTTISGVIATGAGTLTKDGAGTLTLSGLNTFTGLTTVTAGTLNVAVTGGLAGSVLNNATFNNSGIVTGQLTNNAGAGNGGTINGGVINAAGATLTSTGIINGGISNRGTLNAQGQANGAILNEAAGVFTVTGALTGTGALTNSGTAQLLVAGGNFTGLTSVANTSTAATGISVSAGRTLQAGTLSNAAGSTVLNNGTLTTATGTTNAGTLTNSATGTINGGVTNGGTLATSGTLNGGLTNTGTTTASGVIAGGVINSGSFSVAGPLNNSGGSVTNSAPGTITLGAGTTFTNIATFTNNATAANAVLVNAGATLSVTTLQNLAGTFTNLGTVTAPVLSNAGTLTNNGAVTSATSFTNTGTVGNTGTISAAALVNGGIMTSSGTLSGTTSFSNSATVNASGTFNSAAASNSGVFTVQGNLGGATTAFTNQAGGLVNQAGGNFTGIGTFNNAGTFQSTNGAARTLGAGTFNNQATGVINLANGSINDQLTITGAYAGTAGSQVQVDIDLSRQDAGVRSDRVVVAGAGSGASAITFNIINPNRTVFGTPIEVMTTATGAVAVNEGEIVAARRGFFGYFLRREAAGAGSSYQVVSRFNSGPVAGVASGITGMISSLQAGFHQPASAIISRPDNCQPNQLTGGPFIRLSAGETTLKNTTTGDVVGGGSPFSGSSKSATRFSGIQTGADIGVCNINNTGWNVHTGIMGGVVETNTSGLSRTPDPAGGTFSQTRTTAKVEVPFIGAYMFATNGAFTSEINVRKDFYNAKVHAFDPVSGFNFVGPGQKLKGNGLNFNASLSYRFSFGESWYVEPQIGLSKGTTRFSALQFSNSTTDFMTFRTSDSMLGRFGLNVGTAIQATDNLVVVPFLSAAIWHEFAKPTKAQAVFGSNGNQTFDVQTDRVGTFGQVGAGLQFRVLNTPFVGFVRADARFGSKIEGKAVNAGLRMQF